MTFPCFFATCEKRTKNEKNQTNPALRLSNSTVMSWRALRIRVRTIIPSLNGGGSCFNAGDTSKTTFKCLFWLQYLKMRRVIPIPAASALALSGSYRSEEHTSELQS